MPCVTWLRVDPLAGLSSPCDGRAQFQAPMATGGMAFRPRHASRGPAFVIDSPVRHYIFA